MQKDEVHNPNLCELYFSTTLFTPKDNQLSAAAHFGMTGKYFSANALILVPIYFIYSSTVNGNNIKSLISLPLTVMSSRKSK